MSHFLRFYLREKTRQAHESVDARFSTLDLRVRDDFTAFLLAQRSAIAGLDGVFRDAGLGALVEPGLMVAALDVDLATLGAPMPETTDYRGPDGPAARLGISYLLAGSQLGAAVLRRMHAESTDPAVLAADRFLTSKHMLPAWGPFTDALDAAEPEIGPRGAILAGALAGFEAFERAAIRHGARAVA